MKREHTYEARLVWEGNTEGGTTDYASYGREYRLLFEGKPDLVGSADPTFRGDPKIHNPEELFLAAISACHMLTYLALCAQGGVEVLAYEDSPTGRMSLTAEGGGRFEEVVLRPHVTISDVTGADTARRLHEKAHRLCFIASSCNFPIRQESTVRGT